MPHNQAQRRHAYREIWYQGDTGGLRNVADLLDPYLISVKVIDTFGGVYGEGGIDRASAELDERDGKLEIPRNLTH